MPASPERAAARRQAVGDQLRRARQAAGLSQVRLAARAGVNRGFLSDVERGAKGASIDWLCDIADALDVPAATLLATVPGAERDPA